MRKLFAKIIFVLALVALNSCASSTFVQKEFSTLPISKDSTYGYTDGSPLLLKHGNSEKSIKYSLAFLKGLETENNQTLKLLYRASVFDPNYKKPKIQFTDRFTGMPINGKGGILDKYVFLTSRTKDTVILYVDIYHKGELKVPVGLKYEHDNVK